MSLNINMKKKSMTASDMAKLSHKHRHPKSYRLAGLKNGLRLAILTNKSKEVIRLIHEEIALIEKEIK